MYKSYGSTFFNQQPQWAGRPSAFEEKYTFTELTILCSFTGLLRWSSAAISGIWGDNREHINLNALQAHTQRERAYYQDRRGGITNSAQRRRCNHNGNTLGIRILMCQPSQQNDTLLVLLLLAVVLVVLLCKIWIWNDWGGKPEDSMCIANYLGAV